MTSEIQIRSMGYQCILLQWEKTQPAEIFATTQFIAHKYAKEILDLVPTYREIAIYLHHSSKRDQLMNQLKDQLPIKAAIESASTSPIYRIPVCYNTEKGFDLEALAEAKNLSIEEVIQLHSHETYTVHFLGFLPGFPYLSGLNEKLHQPRLVDPRSKVPAGSVGIAGNQTGVYPQDSPGGWNIIGRTPVPLFNIDRDPPALVHEAKYLKFYDISDEEYKQIQHEVSQHIYQIEISDD